MATLKHEADRKSGQKAEWIQNGVLLVGCIAWAIMSLYVITCIL